MRMCRLRRRIQQDEGQGPGSGGKRAASRFAKTGWVLGGPARIGDAYGKDG